VAREFTPIGEVVRSPTRKWPNELITDILEQFEEDDDYSYITRLFVPDYGNKREEVEKQLTDRGAADLVSLLKENGWSVSFLVDCW